MELSGLVAHLLETFSALLGLLSGEASETIVLLFHFAAVFVIEGCVRQKKDNSIHRSVSAACCAGVDRPGNPGQCVTLTPVAHVRRFVRHGCPAYKAIVSGVDSQMVEEEEVHDVGRDQWYRNSMPASMDGLSDPPAVVVLDQSWAVTGRLGGRSDRARKRSAR